jgi:pimeloyl-ACP methyl ester carboxylesterase
VLSPFFKALSADKNLFFFSSQDEFDQLLAISVADVSSIPRSIKYVSYQEGLERMERTKKLFSDIMDGDQKLTHPEQMVDGLLGSIKQPALIIWGDKDGIMDKSMAEVFQRGIRHSQSIVMKNIGHVPMLESPQETGKFIKAFLHSQVHLTV